MEIKKIEFSYGETEFIKDLCGKVDKGKITTILGPNGSGKSTLLNLLVNQLKPKSGDIFVDEQNIRYMKVKDMAKKI